MDNKDLGADRALVSDHATFGVDGPTGFDHGESREHQLVDHIAQILMARDEAPCALAYRILGIPEIAEALTRLCTTCGGEEWVCENHLDRPWDGTSVSVDACGCGAGAPCHCNHRWNQSYGKEGM